MLEHASDRPAFMVINGGGEYSPPIADTGQWPRLGHCQSPDVDPAVMLPNMANDIAVQAARRICRSCIVRSRCLAFAVALPEGIDFAMWGGTSPGERVKIRQQTHNMLDA